MLLVLAVVSTAEPPRPAFPESFTVHTVEIDDTLNGSISVAQVLHRDYAAHRSWMSANGTLVGGQEQIMRCDIHPMGWFIAAGGSDPNNVTTWSCTNQTINSDPQHCQWNLFWEPLPDNATYSGQETVDGRAANRWDYWNADERWALWASLDGLSPIATGKVWTAHPGYHLWHILWRGFEPGPPPLSDFELSAGIQCGPAPPPAPPPTPFQPASDCAPSCGAGASCCQDPLASPPGTCFGVDNCSELPGLKATRAAHIAASAGSSWRSLHQFHAAVEERMRSGAVP